MPPDGMLPDVVARPFKPVLRQVVEYERLRQSAEIISS
jgi:hypothetical protein